MIYTSTAAVSGALNQKDRFVLYVVLPAYNE